MWVEAESSKIGELHVPRELWRVMKAAGGVELVASAGVRAAYLLRTYRHLVDRPDGLKEVVRRLRHRVGEKVVSGWCGWIDAGRWGEFVGDLLGKHYDPAYRHSRERDFSNVREVFPMPGLSDDDLERVADELAGSQVGHSPTYRSSSSTSG